MLGLESASVFTVLFYSKILIYFPGTALFGLRYLFFMLRLVREPKLGLNYVKVSVNRQRP